MVAAVAEQVDLRKQFQNVKVRSSAGIMIFETAVELTKPLTLEQFNNHVKRMQESIELYVSTLESNQ